MQYDTSLHRAFLLLVTTLLPLESASGVPLFEDTLHGTLEVPGSFLRGDFGDFDRDGDGDLLLTSMSGARPGTFLYRNDGARFSPVPCSLPPVHGVSALGDLEGDGDLDLLVAGYDASLRSHLTRVYVYHDGACTQADATLPSLRDSSAAWGDFDGDGDDDLFLSGYPTTSGTPVAKLLKNELGVFTEVQALEGAAKGAAAWGDFDRDGDLDLAYLGRGITRSITRIYRNDHGTFNRVSGTLEGAYWGALDWADYDLDGDLDLFVSGLAGQRITKLYRNDSGAFIEVALGFPGVIHGTVSLKDYDLDGDLDVLVVGWADRGTIADLYRNTDGAYARVDVPFEGAGQSAVLWEDRDGDSDPDLLIHGGTGATGLKEYRNDHGVFTKERLDGIRNGETAWSDIDGDEDLDLLITGNMDVGSAPITRLFRYTSGRFEEAPRDLVDVEGGAASWADYDGDGDPDLALTGENGSGAQTRIYRNDLGRFNDIGASLLPVAKSSAEWGDYDRDGDPDLVVSGLTPREGAVTKLYRNDSGVFSDSGAVLPGAYSGATLWADYDRDGDDDLLIVGRNDTVPGGSYASLHENVHGTFLQSGILLPKYAEPSAAWGDYDSDGDLDLLLGGMRTDRTPATPETVLLRNDQGTLVDSGSPLPALFRVALTFEDFDGDNALDIVLSGSPAPTAEGATFFYRNIGEGFADSGELVPGTRSGHLSFGDFDRDGDRDLAIAGEALIDGAGESSLQLYRSLLNPPADRPDLLAKVDTPRITGRVVISRVMIENIGIHEAPSTVLTVYLSSDRVLDPTDSLISIRHTTSLQSGEGRSVRVSSNLSRSEEGRYYLIVHADARDQVEEHDERNNIAVSVPFEVSRRPGRGASRSEY